MVVGQGAHIVRIELRERNVKVAPPFGGRAINQRQIGGGKQHHPQLANQIKRPRWPLIDLHQLLRTIDRLALIIDAALHQHLEPHRSIRRSTSAAMRANGGVPASPTASQRTNSRSLLSRGERVVAR